MELDLAAAHATFGLPYVIFRPHSVYGEHQNVGDRYRNVVGIFMNRVMRGETMPVFGDGSQTRAISYVGDVVPAIARAVHVPGARGGTFNIGADRPHPVSEIAHSVARAFGVEPRVEHLPARHEVLHACSDHAKVRRVFGDHAATPLDEGIRANGRVGARGRRAAHAALRGDRGGARAARELARLTRDVSPSRSSPRAKSAGPRTAQHDARVAKERLQLALAQQSDRAHHRHRILARPNALAVDPGRNRCTINAAHASGIQCRPGNRKCGSSGNRKSGVCT